jgi:putative acetyltransferase
VNIIFEKADLESKELVDLVSLHKKQMLALSPPGSSHALSLDGLKKPNIMVWSQFDDKELIGCGALKVISSELGEIKAMHTVEKRRGEGHGKKMLTHIINEAKKIGLKRLSLETGAQPGFFGARRLYESFGFSYGGPFGDYLEDANSVFMNLDI